jgi:hypothetical protein
LTKRQILYVSLGKEKSIKERDAGVKMLDLLNRDIVKLRPAITNLSRTTFSEAEMRVFEMRSPRNIGVLRRVDSDLFDACVQMFFITDMMNFYGKWANAHPSEIAELFADIPANFTPMVMTSVGITPYDMTGAGLRAPASSSDRTTCSDRAVVTTIDCRAAIANRQQAFVTDIRRTPPPSILRKIKRNIN